jgi:hypothetical protein
MLSSVMSIDLPGLVYGFIPRKEEMQKYHREMLEEFDKFKKQLMKGGRVSSASCYGD